jgi:bacillithiol biosynthesis cysteine-adding enzyme BshC
MSQAFQPTYIPYSQINNFSKIILDYIEQAQELKEFYEHTVNIEGIKSAISKRKKFSTNREILVEQLQAQYKNAENNESVQTNITALLNENAFTVCTAHQPNIFTGHLYFIYKIIHTIKVANDLKKQLPEYNFIPVFFMGSEDADFAELNHVVIDGKKYEWQTKQTGAIGRMIVDDNLLKLIDEISGRVSVEKYGGEIIKILKDCFKNNSTIQEATFLFVHYLFKSYGLIVFLPDNAALKKLMLPVFEDDIFKNISSKIVNRTSEKLLKKYKVQAQPREINLFYFKENIRNRIVQSGENFIVNDTDIVFTAEGLLSELHEHPENFSPNVILRGLYQETILPNIAFIGGGGELAYWLQLKDLFINYHVPFPMLVLRNSFLIIEKKFQNLLKKLNLNSHDLFRGQENLFNEIVKNQSKHRLKLDDEKSEMQRAYNSIKKIVEEIDGTLKQHTEALETKNLQKLSALEKKMLRAEKRKFSDQKNQLAKIFSMLFPGENLQERTENFMLFYAKWGKDFFQMLYENSLTLEQEFCVIEEEV